ncbi:unnamed protein product [Trifolium pratense]|uniref:Uncharacterized protein n=1 Tax=Trifolium pratense TaxID=57577 RepID=A0ACB0JN23_TRIPR|nr:unnamed protein product [Trifolium pratense]
MDKILKFVCVMIILLCKFLVSAQFISYISKPCVRDSDCPLCIYPIKRRCRKSVCMC